MVQTKLGSQKAVATILAKDPDHFKKIGKIGGTKSRGGGFTGNPEMARKAGAVGGAKSRRGKAAPKEMLFVDDSILIDEEFGDGFFQPTWKQRMLSKIRSL